ncbi:MAG: gamma carbonic anhydrase family protein [Rhizobiales bacterium NRL2]|jgi:carbonic anhydrase/acetyltransferase-like protein (isoleucine patch superfamily)|nr:MAG: gamma carbonic anhydrase family protein [Rhizobiales bacterium NRL2]
MEKGACHPYRGTWPEIADDVFLAPGSQVIGDVKIGARSSIWFNCVLRGDVNHIRIGQRTNLQDGTVVHVNGGGSPTIIGDDVLVGHKVMLHGCELQDRSFVGMNSIILDGCVIESGGMVAAGAFVTPNKIVRKGELWAGWPAKCLREITDGDRKLMERGAPHYAELAAEYRALQN